MSRFRWAGFLLLVSALLCSGCLGQDWKSFPLGAGESDHGWLLRIEPDETFDVLVVANALYPDLPWVVSEYDPAVIEPAGAEVEDYVRTWGDWDMSAPEAPQGFLPIHIFQFSGMATGQTPLVLEVRNGDQLVEVLEVTVSVVEDACAADGGLKAARCGHDPRDEQAGEGVEGIGMLEELDHGWLVNLEPVDTFVVRLLANAVYPEAEWRVAEFDPDVIDVQVVNDTDVRAAGDWDTTDMKPSGFLATTSFTVKARDYGRSPLVLEVVVDGERVDVYELVVAVVDDACAPTEGLTPCHN